MVVLVLLALGAAVVAPVLSSRADRRDDPVAAVRARAARLGRAIDTTIAGRALRITPDGVCLPDGPAEGAARWDPAHCRLVGAP